MYEAMHLPIGIYTNAVCRYKVDVSCEYFLDFQIPWDQTVICIDTASV